MFAVIRDGGRQFTVREGDRILVDHKDGAEAGKQVRFEDVLLIADEKGASKIGTPSVAGAAVVGKVLGDRKGDKLVVFKYRRRKNSKRKSGHRQLYTAVLVEKIQG
jgi:large subunit ribosomal protein L21